MELKKIALHDIHLALGGKMVPFAGFEMPVRYSSDKEEHLAVRTGVGVFDVSHMGEFFLYGDKALELIQRISSNDASKLFDGKAQYGCLPNGKGGIVDDFLTYKFSDDKYMLVVNASNIKKDWDWITEQNAFGVTMEDASDKLSLFAVQGPKAVKVLQKLTEVSLSEMEYYTFKVGRIAGIDEVIISATGYTGAGGFELYVANDKAPELWQRIFEAGAEEAIKPIGLGARDTLRLEMGFCLYGNDIDDTTSPLEAGLGWVTKFSKEFVDAPFLEKQKKEGVTRKLIGFKMVDKGIPRRGYGIFSDDKTAIGEVTSGSISPLLNIGIGLGYVQTAFSKPGTIINVSVRDKMLKAEIVKPPFIS